MFTEFSGKVVCLDATHSTNQYRHKLVTLMVADEFQNGEQEKMSLLYLDIFLQGIL